GYLAIRVQPRVAMPRKGVPVLVRVKLHEQADLAQIIQARDPFAFGLGARQGRQKQPGEYGNDRDHDQQFDQGETRPALSARRTRRTSQTLIAVPKRSPGLRKSSRRQRVHRLRLAPIVQRGIAIGQAKRAGYIVKDPHPRHPVVLRDVEYPPPQVITSAVRLLDEYVHLTWFWASRNLGDWVIISGGFPLV